MEKKNIDHYGINAKEALKSLSLSDNKQRNNALNETAKLLKANINQILDANKIDIENSKRKSLSNSFIDRLSLDKKRINSIIDGLMDISKLEDPLNKVHSTWDTKWFKYFKNFSSIRCHWNYLRIKTKCNNRCRCTLH